MIIEYHRNILNMLVIIDKLGMLQHQIAGAVVLGLLGLTLALAWDWVPPGGYLWGDLWHARPMLVVGVALPWLYHPSYTSRVGGSVLWSYPV